MVPVAFLVTIIVFVLLRLAPGDPVLAYAGEVRDPEILERDAPLARARSAAARAVRRLARATRCRATSAARSGPTSRSARRSSSACPPRSSSTGAALLFSVTIALVVGTLSALHRNSALDLLATSVTIAGVSVPNFFLGLMLILLFSLVLRVFPPGGYAPVDRRSDRESAGASSCPR